MNTAVINIKISPDLKIQAQRLAKELGFSLSSLIHAYLKQLVKTRTIVFSAREEPTDYLLQALEESKEDVKKGKISPAFDDVEAAIKWLNSSRKKYAGKIQ